MKIKKHAVQRKPKSGSKAGKIGIVRSGSGFRAAACFVVILLLLYEFAADFAPVAAAGQNPVMFAQAAPKEARIEIGSVDEFLAFAEACVYDIYGDGKTFVLTADLDLAGMEFAPVPIFGGTFDGNGHVISNLKISARGSGIGLFSIIKENGTVRNLSVTGSVVPSGSRENIGGIAGINRGRIENCRFSGEIGGTEASGGIAGLNGESGVIAGCTNEAVIRSEKRAGGIAGRNAGRIEESQNYGSVNVWEEKNNTEDIGGIAGFNEGTIERCKNGGTIGYEHIGYNVGGIAGRHNGVISDCENDAAVSGRKDVGGIAGQFEPFLMLVYEEDSVQAMEKALSGLRSIFSDLSGEITDLVDQGAGNTKELNRQLDRLESVSSGAVLAAGKNGKDSWDDLDGAFTVIKEEIDTFSAQCDAFRESTKKSLDAIQNAVSRIRSVTEKAADTADTNISKTIDEISADLKVINKEIEDLSDSVDGSSASIHSSLARMKKEADQIDSALRGMKNTVQNSASHGIDTASGALDVIRDELDSLFGTGGKTDPEAYAEAAGYAAQADELLESLSRGGDDRTKLAEELDEVLTRLENTELPAAKESQDKKDFPDADQMKASLQVIRDQAEIIRKAVEDTLKTSGNALSTGIESVLSSLSKINQEAGKLSDEIDSEIGRITSGVRTISRYLSYIDTSVDSFADTASGDRKKLQADLKGPLDTLTLELGNISDQTYEISKSLTKSVETINEQAAVISDTLNTSITRLSDGIDSTVTEISDILNAMNAVVDQMTDEVGSSNARIKEYMKRLDRQLELIETIAGEAGEDVESLGNQDLFSDISDAADSNLYTDISDITDNLNFTENTDFSDNSNQKLSLSAPSTSENSGEITGCINRGEVGSDVNAGGIAGIAAMELSGDPEVDVSFTEMGRKSLKSFRYARAVIRSSSNQADVTVKNTYAGGIVGRADLGAVTDCVNLGNITNQGGAFTGGIAGSSDGVIRACHVLCDLTGGDDTGGIAGYSDEVYDCTAIVTIDSDGERIGAIAGTAATLAAGNYFLKEGLAGIDGVNYEGSAMPLSYDELGQLESVPKDFFEIQVSFVAEGKLIKAVSAGYGEALKEEDIPEVPEKEGYFAEWEAFDRESVMRSRIVEAQYYKWLTTVESREKAGDRPLLLAEGSFSGEAVLTVEMTDGSGEKLPLGWEYESAYRFELSDPKQADAAVKKVRIYVPEEDGVKHSVLIAGSKSVISDCRRDGSYLVFETGKSVEFLVVRNTAGEKDFTILGIAAAAVFLSGVLFLIFRKRRQRKRRPQEE